MTPTPSTNGQDDCVSGGLPSNKIVGGVKTLGVATNLLTTKLAASWGILGHRGDIFSKEKFHYCKFASPTGEKAPNTAANVLQFQRLYLYAIESII